ncbi:MAG: VWA domain-containing protein [Candidatus Omnitrophica bacterium]|nr:VWA domain-containing protein [Candidatus Omnitrophota bacterium]
MKSATDDIGEQYTSRMPNAAVSLRDGTKSLGNTLQYEPYYTNAVAINSPSVPLVQVGEANTEEYASIEESRFLESAQNPLSTFSIDVDTGSYTNLRRYLTSNQLPPKDAIRIEEMINYFSYDYPKPEGDEPFSVTTKAAVCPWNADHRLILIGLKGKTPDVSKLPPSNLTFLLDVSGSMQSPDKLPLIQQAFTMMVRQLRDQDKVAIVVYAGAERVALESTPGTEKEVIISAIQSLMAGGSTAGGAGIKKAYAIAKENFIPNGNNRVILATDGDFNVGVSSTSEMTRLIEEKRNEGIFLTVIGVGSDGNLKDGRLEQIADKGNGSYYYFDSLQEAKKVFMTELGSTLFTIAKDVKIQVEFNPSAVKAYRLIGYENRKLNKEDFNDDKKDAGEIGAGHTVTALYEIIPAGSAEKTADVDALKYQKAETVKSDEMLTLKLRYKEPKEDTSKLITKVLNKTEIKDAPQGDFAFAASVAEMGMLLRHSEFKGTSTYDQVLQMGKAAKGDDKFGYREEFIRLVETAQALDVSNSGGMQFK